MKREQPERTGSLGAGLLLEPSILAILCPNPGGLKLNIALSRVETLPGPLETVLEEMGFNGRKYTLIINSPVPLAVGFAVSAATALTAAMVLAAQALKSIDEAAVRAHVAEVVHGTGLGDVIAQYMGRMLEVRISPGAPGIGKVESYPVEPIRIVSIILQKQTTRRMHEAIGERIKQYAPRHYAAILEDPRLETLLEESRLFSIETGMAPRDVASLLDRLHKKMLIGWYVKKGVAIVVPENEYYDDVIQALKELKKPIMTHSVSGTPAGIRPCTYQEAIQGTGAL